MFPSFFFIDNLEAKTQDDVEKIHKKLYPPVEYENFGVEINVEIQIKNSKEGFDLCPKDTQINFGSIRDFPINKITRYINKVVKLTFHTEGKQTDTLYAGITATLKHSAQYSGSSNKNLLNSFALVLAKKETSPPVIKS